jgi:ferredoxin
MKLRLDRSACQGHGRCYALAPELFGCDEEGYSVLIAPGELTVDQQDAARRAVNNCPEFAITLDEE